MDEELKFILRMRDEATAVLKQHASAHRATGADAKNTAKAGKEAANSLNDLIAKAKEATQVVAGFWASWRIGSGSTNAFASYELGLIGVQKTTDMTSKELRGFSTEFDKLAAKMKGVPMGQLLEFSEAAGQMGVRGTQSLLSFTEVMGKLGVTTDIVGKEGAMAVGRLLAITGEGVAGIKTFGDTLNYLGNKSKATEAEILRMATSIGQSTAGMRLSTQAVLGLAAAAKEVGLPDELTGSAFGRVLRNLSDGAANATKGFKDFLAVTGMTKSQFDELMQQQPDRVLIRFAEAYAALQPTGQSGKLLDNLGLNTDEIKRVFGTIGQSADEFYAKLAALRAGSANGALDRESAMFFGASANEIAGAIDAINRFKVAWGEALAPVVGPIVRAATTLISDMAASFRELPVSVKSTIAVLLTFAPAALGAVAAIRLITPALKLISVLSGMRGLLAWLKSARAAVLLLITAFTSFGRVAAILALAKAALASLGGAVAAVAAVFAGLITWPIALGVAMTAVAVLVIRNWEKVKAFFSLSWSDMGKVLKDAIIGAFTFAVDWAKGLWSRFLAWLKGAMADTGEAAAPQGDKSKGAGGKGGVSPFGEILAGVDLGGSGSSGGGGGAKATVADVTRSLQDQIATAKAISGEQKYQVELQQQIRQAADQLGVSYKAAEAAVGGLVIALQDARRAAAIEELIDGYDRQIESAMAYSAAQKEQVEIEHALLDLRKEHGRVSTDEERTIENRIRSLNEVKKAAAYREQIDAIGMQLIASQALTREERNRFSILEKLVEFQREYGALAQESAMKVASALQAAVQQADWNTLRDNLDPIGEATRQYEDDLATLNAEMARGGRSAGWYNQMLDRLITTYAESRDPVSFYVDSMREEIRLSGLKGRQYDVERNALSDLNALRRAGVDVTSDMAAAVREYAVAMVDANRASSNGLGGWVNSIEEMRDALLTLERDAASGFVDALVDGLYGESDSFAKFFQGLAKQATKMLIEQQLKGLIGGAADSRERSALDRADAALAKLDALGKAGISTNEAIVNAGTVLLNGSLSDLVSHSREIANGALLPSNDNSVGPVDPQVAAAGKAFESAAEGLKSASSAAATTSIDAEAMAKGVSVLGTAFGAASHGLGGFQAAIGELLKVLVTKGGGGSAAGIISTVLGAVLHKGGDNRSASYRAIPAGAYAGAPRFHNGFAPDEYPAVLQTGERVLNRAETRAYESGLRAAGTKRATGAIVISPTVSLNFQGGASGGIDEKQAVEASAAMKADLARYMETWVQKEMRPGGRLAKGA